MAAILIEPTIEDERRFQMIELDPSYLWYILGGASIPLFILFYVKTLKRWRAEKTIMDLRRRRAARQWTARRPAGSIPANGNKSEAASPPETAPISRRHWLEASKTKREPHWLENLKWPAGQPEGNPPANGNRSEAGPISQRHWLWYLKTKGNAHWLENLKK